MQLRRVFSAFLLVFLAIPAILAADRIPGEGWQRYADPSEAGFDPARLASARETWETLPSSAFMVIADGAVVASWGDVDRRFMCHSVRKSFLSALYGIYWDRGEIELNKTLADLGIDDEPEPLLDGEKRARILDLLKARSGVFHPAAYAGRTDSRPRGSEGPGRYFAYNNWDFNTLATILEQETGDSVFEAFDEHFGRPLQMEDWRVSDGYFHYERDKSKYPAYPFRLSARDAARIGLLFTREGLWGEKRILSEQWVRRSSALYSIDNDVMGYGFMWWILREPRFAQYGAFAAAGVGNQMIVALPGADIVVVNRANTYQGEGTPGTALLDLIEQVLEARTGTSISEPRLAALDAGAAESGERGVATEQLAEFAGDWPYPPASLGLAEETRVTISVEGDHLLTHEPGSGTFKHYLQADGTLFEEDSHRRYYIVRNDKGRFDGIAGLGEVINGALVASAGGEGKRAKELIALLGDGEELHAGVARALVDFVGGKRKRVESTLGALATEADAARVEAIVNRAAYEFLGRDQNAMAREILELNTRLFPEAFNTWDSLGELQMGVGETQPAIASYRRSLELNPDNSNAERMIELLSADPGN